LQPPSCPTSPAIRNPQRKRCESGYTALAFPCRLRSKTLSDTAATIEHHTIGPIPHDARHGRARDLFTVWFGANVMILTVVTGTLGPAIFHLGFAASLLAIACGNLAGGIFMALHAAQGPTLGVPQMVQSRGQFGLWGAAAIMILVVIMYGGFAASNLALGGTACARIAPFLGHGGGIAAMVGFSAVPAVFGYRLIHAANRFATVTGAIGFVALAIATMPLWLSPTLWTTGHWSIAGFVGALSISAVWQLAYAPFVSDYARYLPAGSQGSRHAFAATYGGSVAGSMLAMILGALIGASGIGDATDYLLHAGGLGHAGLALLMPGLMTANAMCLYCGALCAIGVAQTFRPKARFGAGSRISLTLVIAAATTLAGAAMSRDFLDSYTSMLAILMTMMVPWTAINLADYYLVRHGHYDVDAFFAPDGGRYGLIDWRACCAYVAGVLIQVPLIANPLYTGPLAFALGGIDLSWVAGLVGTGVLFLVLARSRIST